MRNSTRPLTRTKTRRGRGLEATGDHQTEERNSAGAEPGGKVRRAGLAISRICRGMSYDEIVLAAADARQRLGLRRPKDRKRVVARLSRPELDQLLEHAYRTGGGRGLLVKTLVYTGTRVSEFVALDVDDFSYDDKTITVRRGKGDKDRVVPILPALADELAVHKGAARPRAAVSDPLVGVLLSAAGAADRQGAGRRRGHHEAGLPHLMRHTVAQLLLEGGMPLEQVQRFLGHSKIATTQIYAESSTAMIRDAYRKALG